MIREEAFWNEELEAPLLNRNSGFLKPETIDEVSQRTLQWLDLVEDKGVVQDLQWCSKSQDEAIDRIFTLDAERTFKNDKHRKDMTETLSTIYQVTQDYHQGMGFIVAFLLLLLDKEDVVKLVLGLHHNYVPGYFKAAPINYVRDAKVFEIILKQINPELHKHITALVPAEAYCSKWFVGFNVHVLPFSALASFLEAFFSYGGDFHFQFAMALVQKMEQQILATKDVGKVLAILRLDTTERPDHTKAIGSDVEGSFFQELIDDAKAFQLDDLDLTKYRTEAYAELYERQIKREAREQELFSEDEIVFSDEED